MTTNIWVTAEVEKLEKSLKLFVPSLLTLTDLSLVSKFLQVFDK